MNIKRPLYLFIILCSLLNFTTHAAKQRKSLLRAKTTSLRAKSSLQKKHVPRPMNCFMAWSLVERKKLALQFPHLPNSEISKMLGKMWRSLSVKERTKWKRIAEKIATAHRKQFPDYKYQPRPKKTKNNRKKVQTQQKTLAPSEPIEDCSKMAMLPDTGSITIADLLSSIPEEDSPFEVSLVRDFLRGLEKDPPFDSN